MLVGVILMTIINMSNAQTNKEQTLLTIGNSKISLFEFENVYHKNNMVKTAKDEKSVNDYVELFVNFKLKVKEAEELGLDTVKKFKDELAGYRKQLAQPYLTDREVNEKLLKETYDRLKEEVCVSHILVRCSETASPKDTLAAYNRIMKIYSRIQKGTSFEKLASEKGISDDTSLVSKAGYIGCFTALDLVYSFETVAYNTKVGEVSKPVRTRFGYHIIKVNERRNARGEVLVAHIMIKTPPRASKGDSLNQEKKINEIYEKLKAGAKFDRLASEFSDDKETAAKAGELAWFGINRTPPDFETAAFSLKNKGDISKPIRTPYGMHIIKLIDKREIGSYDEVKNELKQKLTKASRFTSGREALIAKLKKEYNCTENKKALEEFYTLVDTSLFEGKWSIEKAKTITTKKSFLSRLFGKKDSEKSKSLKEVLFNLKDKQFTQEDFAKYITEHERKRAKMDIKMAVDELYKQYEDATIINFENDRLEQKYPEFKALMQEYRDGILLFELTDKKVWSKAIKDTAGLLQYYENNKNKYTWGERAVVDIYSCSDKAIAETVRTMLKKGASQAEILKVINKDSQLNLSVENKNFNKGENEWADKNWMVGISDDITSEKDNKIVLINVKKIEQNAIKSLEEARGTVISDYQNYLEKQWIDELKKKYTVSIDKQVLAEVK
jgi:peptidyl-prolyl cis-trans isomerase SurA